MSLRDKPLEAITQADLQGLIDNKVAEGKEYDYKLTLPKNSDGDKKEFLADVSSFANTIGGDFIFGVQEEEGVPVAIPGLSGINVDSEKLRLENMIRDGIEPRIANIDMCPVPLDNPTVLIIRIPQSWSSPHMVTFSGHGKFYARNSAGKYPLDVHELRTAFNLSEATAERIRRFRIDRLSKIAAGDTPARVQDGAKLVLHLVPISAFARMASLEGITLAKVVVPIVDELRRFLVGSYKHNLDGFLCFDGSFSPYSYIQFFRNGVIEFTDTHMLGKFDGKGEIRSEWFEPNLIELVPKLLYVQGQLGIQPPYFIMLSFTGVRGYTMGISRLYSVLLGSQQYPIDRDELILPEIMVEDVSGDIPQIMRPVFDMVWNACGCSGSPNYNNDGVWQGR